MAAIFDLLLTGLLELLEELQLLLILIDVWLVMLI